MRWDNLKLVDAPLPDGMSVPLFEQGAVVRRFDTPEFRGMTFYEIRARSIINRVPEASRVPFRWTINPYRGCSHACFYCMRGDTAVLMADGRRKRLADIEVGDRILGTLGDWTDRRYVVTSVLAQWSVVKPAYRVTLEDGTELVTSAKHRFLTDAGWRHVTTDHQSLTTENLLCGSGRFGAPPEVDAPVKPDHALRLWSVEPIAGDQLLYDITTGTGDFIANGVVSHNCFARNTHTYLDLDYGEDFNSQIVVKVNAGELLRKELSAPRWTGEHIAMGTNTDPYQRAEGRYKLMRGILEALRDFANPFSILTKGSLILRDLDLLQRCAEVADIGTNVSVGCVDRELWRVIEPGTPSPQKRLEVSRTLNQAGIGCGVLMAPIIPFISDTPSLLEETVHAIAETGATHVTPIVLHLRPGAREWFFRWLAENRPDLVPRYERLYARGSYSPKAFQDEIGSTVQALAERFGIGQSTPRHARRVSERPQAPEPEQMSLM